MLRKQNSKKQRNVTRRRLNKMSSAWRKHQKKKKKKKMEEKRLKRKGLGFNQLLFSLSFLNKVQNQTLKVFYKKQSSSKQLLKLIIYPKCLKREDVQFYLICRPTTPSRVFFIWFQCRCRIVILQNSSTVSECRIQLSFWRKAKHLEQKKVKVLF